MNACSDIGILALRSSVMWHTTPEYVAGSCMSVSEKVPKCFILIVKREVLLCRPNAQKSLNSLTHISRTMRIMKKPFYVILSDILFMYIQISFFNISTRFGKASYVYRSPKYK